MVFCVCVFTGTVQNEGPDSGGRVRHQAATSDPEPPQTAGGVRQQAHGAAPDRGSG